MTPLRELYDLYHDPNPAKEERRQQLLAEIPTDARDGENYGRTSLHIAAEFADCEAIASLLDRGAEVNDRDEEGHTPLFRLASRRSRVPALEEPIATAARLLLGRGANLPRSARGTTALLEAVQNRHHAMAAVLIDSGQRLDSANSYGDNALHILCRRAADKSARFVVTCTGTRRYSQTAYGYVDKLGFVVPVRTYIARDTAYVIVARYRRAKRSENDGNVSYRGIDRFAY